jgi:hypothetical protein
MNLVSLAVKAGAYQQAAALLKAERAGTLNTEQAFIIRLSVGWNYGDPQAAKIEVSRYDLCELLMDAIEAAGFEVSGATDSRAEGEPVWLCNARALISKCSEVAQGE